MKLFRKDYLEEIPGEGSLSHYRKDAEDMDLHHFLILAWRWKHRTVDRGVTAAWRNSSHPKRVVEGGWLAGKVWKRRCITGITRGHAKVLWEPKDKNKQQSSLSRMEVSAPHMAYMLLSGITSSMLTSSSWFFILPLTKIASLHPDVFHGFWAQFLWVIDSIHCGPTDFTHHTSAGVRKYTLPWPKEAKTLHRHLTDYRTAQTREPRVDRTCTSTKAKSM